MFIPWKFTCCIAESVKPVDEFDLYLSDGEVIVHSAVGGSELTNTAKSGKIKEKNYNRHCILLICLDIKRLHL